MSETTALPLPLSSSLRLNLNEVILVSGQIAEKELLSADVQTQTRSVFKVLAGVLEKERRTLKDVVRVGVFLADIADFAAFNEVYREFFTAPFPVRTTVAVRALPLGAKVEVEAIAR